MNKSTIFLGILAIIILGLGGAYLYIVYKLHDTRSGIQANIVQMQTLHQTLAEQKKEIESKYLPMIDDYLAQKDSKSNLFAGLGVLQTVTQHIPLVSTLPIPHIQQEVAASLNDVFNALDVLLNNAKNDLTNMVKTVNETLPLIEQTVSLQQQTVTALQSVTPVSIIRALLHV